MGTFSTYKNMINDTFSSVSESIGIHVMLLVVEHALWNTRHKFEDATVIEFSEDGINLDGLENLPNEKAEIIAQDLAMAIVATLGRLVGKQLARQLIRDLELDKVGEA